MSVEDRNIIDFVYKQDGEVVLCISDHISWDNTTIIAHWDILQDKLKDYMRFIQSGQYKEIYPEDSLNPCIKIFFSCMWTDLVGSYLEKMKVIYAEYGCNLIWVFDPQKNLDTDV